MQISAGIKIEDISLLFLLRDTVFFSCIFSYIQVVFKMSDGIPLVIVIINNDGQIIYKAYTPVNFDSDSDSDSDSGSDFDDNQATKFDQFMTRLYNHIQYNNSSMTSNQTNMGQLLEIHTRWFDVPSSDRGSQVWFCTYQHQHTSYEPVHRNSPIFFNQNNASDYAEQQQALTHRTATHEFI